MKEDLYTLLMLGKLRQMPCRLLRQNRQNFFGVIGVIGVIDILHNNDSNKHILLMKNEECVNILSFPVFRINLDTCSRLKYDHMRTYYSR